MLNFRRFISERVTKITAYTKVRGSRNPWVIEIRAHVNPGAAEIETYTMKRPAFSSRILYDFEKKKMYMWDASEAIHQAVIDGMGVNRNYDYFLAVASFNPIEKKFYVSGYNTNGSKKAKPTIKGIPVLDELVKNTKAIVLDTDLG